MTEDAQPISEDVLQLATRIHNRIVFIRKVRGTVELLDRRAARKGEIVTQEAILDNLDTLSGTLLDDIDRLCEFVHSSTHTQETYNGTESEEN